MHNYPNPNQEQYNPEPNNYTLEHQRIRLANSWVSDNITFNENMREANRRRNYRDIQDGLGQWQLQPLTRSNITIGNYTLPIKIDELLHTENKKLSSLWGIDYTSSLVILLCSLLPATCGCVDVQLDNNWTESGVENLILVAPSGSRKSTIAADLRRPYEQFTLSKSSSIEELPIEFQDEVKKELSRKTKIEVRKMVEDFMSADISSSEFKTNAESYIEKVNKINPQKPNFLVSSATAQQLARRLSENGEFLYILESEGDFFKKIDKCSDIEKLLIRGYSGEPYSFSKFSLSSPHIYSSFLIQENVASDLYNNYKWINEGFLSRFLVIFPEIRQKEKLNAESNPYLCEVAKIYELLYDRKIRLFKDSYNNKLTKLLEKLYTNRGNSSRYSIGVNPSALFDIKKFRNNMEGKKNSCHKDLFPFLNRAHGHAVRLALAYHLFCNEDPLISNITLEEMGVGISLCERLMPSIEFAYSPHGFRALPLAIKIVDNLKSISFQEQSYLLQDGIKSSVIEKRLNRKKADVDNALTLLAMMNYLTIYDKGDGSNHIILHPGFFYSPNTI